MFRLMDFETHFQVNKKTAWIYLNLPLKTWVSITCYVFVSKSAAANRLRAGPGGGWCR
jgi:hypothetical protein